MHDTGVVRRLEHRRHLPGYRQHLVFSERASLFRASVQVVEPKPLPRPVCRDATNDVVLATGVAAEADAIVTGDQDLFVLGSYQDISIVSPRSFLERLNREAG